MYPLQTNFGSYNTDANCFDHLIEGSFIIVHLSFLKHLVCLITSVNLYWVQVYLLAALLPSVHKRIKLLSYQLP